MTPEETAFAIQQPLSFVQQYIRLIKEFALDDQRVMIVLASSGRWKMTSLNHLLAVIPGKMKAVS